MSVGAETGKEYTIPKSWSDIPAIVSCLTWVLGTEFRPLGNATRLLTADRLSSPLLLLSTDLIVKIVLKTITTAAVSLLNINVSNDKGRRTIVSF